MDCTHTFYRFALGMLLFVATASGLPRRAQAEVVLEPPRFASTASVPWQFVGRPVRAIPRKALRERFFPSLPDEPADRSVSIGTVTDGWVARSAQLPLPGPTWAVLPRQHTRRLIYGTDGLIQTLMTAADAVAARHPGAILWLGNIGAQGGGDILWSVSHNAGRDADLAFYATDPAGRPVYPPDLLHYDRRGRSREYGGWYRFDVARNWTLVEALIASPHAELQYLFISEGLRSLLLDWARTHGVDAATLERATALLNQPGGALPHDDHLHLRIYCGRLDMGGGCEDIGVRHAWIPDLSGMRDARLQQAASLLRSDEASTRVRALQRLAFVGAVGQIVAMRSLLEDPVPQVRAEATRAIGQLGGPRQVGWLEERYEEETDPEVLLALVLAAGDLGGDGAAGFLHALLAAPRPVVVRGKPADLRLVALDALGRMGRPGSAAAIVPLLAEPSAEVRLRAERALRMLTNHELANVCVRSADAPVIEAHTSAWQRWLREHPCDERIEWLDAGFGRAGYDTTGNASARARELARAAGDSRFAVRVNAQRELMRMTDHRPPSLTWPPDDARAYWARWVRRNDHRIRRR
jgi:penicillin-insensitive murein endopeptidase